MFAIQRCQLLPVELLYSKAEASAVLRRNMNVDRAKQCAVTFRGRKVIDLTSHDIISVTSCLPSWYYCDNNFTNKCENITGLSLCAKSTKTDSI